LTFEATRPTNRRHRRRRYC